MTAQPTNRPNSDDAAANGTASTETHVVDRTDHGYRYDSFPAPRQSTASATAAAACNGSTGGGDGKPIAPSIRALAPDLLRGLLMMLMACDHAALALGTWEHGTGRVMEGDGQVVRRWNYTAAFVVRSLTHLCASGFTFLLGMGVVYLGRSRTKLGWSPARLTRYFGVRCAVLTAVTVVCGFLVTAGQIWFLNIVLFALAVDYLLAGLLWQGISRTEDLLTRGIGKMRKRAEGNGETAWTDDGDEDGVTQPLLRQREATRRTATSHDAHLSWSLHNALLLVLTLVTIFWNIWLSDDGGVCSTDGDVSTLTSPSNPVLRIWFWIMMDNPPGRVLSGFPPLAWLSFAILGILYARIMTARPWTRRASVLGHMCAALCFAVLFVLTRVLHVGNLSEACLQTPDQERHPGQNPYLASVASFFYVVKYPPDVAFFALTMAGNMLLLAAFTALPPRVGKQFTMLLDFGTSALFFYLVHLLVVNVLAVPVVALFGHDVAAGDGAQPTRAMDDLFGYFVFWAVAMLLMWPLCRWYSRFKSTKTADSIWRLF